jgi:uncharacterized membrane protein
MTDVHLFDHVPHPRLHRRHQLRPVRTRDAHDIRFNGRLAAWLTRRLGSMGVVYATLAGTAIWMALGAPGVFGFDPYPYPLLLFVGNVVQLLLIFVIMVGQQVLGAASNHRADQTYEDAQAILAECEQLQAHMEAQDRLLNTAAAHCADIPVCRPETGHLERPARVADAAVGAHQHLAVWLTRKLGSMSACYLTAAAMGGWMLVAGLGLLRSDPYPFPFLLFLSSLAQLVLMVVIMVGQDVIGRGADQRTTDTFHHAEAVLRQCQRLQQHMSAQDTTIAHVVHELTRRARTA